MNGWEIITMEGFRINSPYMARDPQCPKERHPTRDCRCKVFKTHRDAAAYVAEQEENA